MWAPNYQCGLVKIDKLGAHMAPGVLKLYATLNVYNIESIMKLKRTFSDNQIKYTCVNFNSIELT